MVGATDGQREREGEGQGGRGFGAGVEKNKPARTGLEGCSTDWGVMRWSGIEACFGGSCRKACNMSGWNRVGSGWVYDGLELGQELGRYLACQECNG